MLEDMTFKTPVLARSPKTRNHATAQNQASALVACRACSETWDTLAAARWTTGGGDYED